MKVKDEQIGDAIAAVSNSIERMDARIASLEALDLAAKEARRKRLDALVASSLPDISNSVWTRLRAVYPAFASKRKVEDAFQANRRLLGLVKRSTHDMALLMLRTELKAFLEGCGSVQEQDEEMASAAAEKGRLFEQRQEAMKVLHSLQRISKSTEAVPAADREIIEHLARKGRILSPGSHPATPRAPQLWSGGAANLSSYGGPSLESGDVWMWMLTDIPTSARTLMASMVTNRADTRSHHETTGDVEKCVPELEEVGRREEQKQGEGVVMSSHQQCMAAEPGAIATDDSLGSFS